VCPWHEGIERDADTCLFEEFTNCRHAVRIMARGPVDILQASSRKHVRPAHKRDLVVAAHHEHFDTVVTIPKQKNGRRWYRFHHAHR
jgi:hypothetical protein